MRFSVIGLIFAFIFLSTYKPKISYFPYSKFKINEIIIQNNSIVSEAEIKNKLAFLYDSSLFFLEDKKISEILINNSFIESFKIKKIYPNKIIISISEQKPIAVVTNKKEKFYITEKGKLINFKKINVYDNLPEIIGNGEKFIYLYNDLKNLNFPISEIRSYLYFEGGRWDILFIDGTTIKLPIKNFKTSLKKHMNLKKTNDFDKFKIFDYRIKNQLILN